MSSKTLLRSQVDDSAVAVSSRTMSLSRYGRLKFVRSAKSVSSFSFKHFRCHLSWLVLQMCCSRQADVLEARARSGREVGSREGHFNPRLVETAALSFQPSFQPSRGGSRVETGLKVERVET